MLKNPIFKLGIVLVVVLAGAFVAVRAYQKQGTEFEHKLGIERIRREYLERAPMARMMAEPDRYGDEQRAIWKWYFNELTGHFNKYGAGLRNYDRFMDELVQRKKNKKIKQGEFEQYEERFKLTKEVFDLIQSGRYTPLYTGVDKGLRFDVYEVKPVQLGNEPALRISFMLTGAQRKWQSENKVTKMVVNASFNELVFKGLDDQDKPIREMRATGDPFKIDYPERFVDEFPPGHVFGYYEIPKIPHEVVKAELTFNINTRSVLTGEEIAGTYLWKMPLEREWRLSPGSGWEGAQEQVREEAPPEAAPAAAPAKKRRR